MKYELVMIFFPKPPEKKNVHHPKPRTIER